MIGTIRLLRLAAATSLCLFVAACAPQDDGADAPLREITNIAGNLYEARDNIHNTVFLVTPDGVILGDPIGIVFARWLKTELAERFDSTVKYVIYSHHHPEHATGGIVFADTATFVAHENVVSALNAPFPSNAGQMDRNGNGRIERSEATDPGYPGNFDTYDRDGDDSITGIEINADTPRPDIVYSTDSAQSGRWCCSPGSRGRCPTTSGHPAGAAMTAQESEHPPTQSPSENPPR